VSYIHRLLGVTAALLLSLAACSGDKSNGGGEQSKATAFPNSVVDEEVLVRVNSEPIQGRDLRVFTLIYGSGTLDSLRSRNFNERALDGLIDRQLLLQEAKAAGVSVDDSTHQWFVRQFTQAVGGDAGVDRLIKSVGCSRYELEQVIRKDLIIRSFLESSVMQTIEIPDSIAFSYFEQNPDQFWVPDSVRARHIILRASPDDTEADKEAKKQTLRDLARRVKEGEDFAELAKQYSEGPSAPRGGDLGYFTKRDMVPAFSDVAFGLEEGEVSGVVETAFGYHLIQVVDKKPGRKLEYDEISQGLKEQLKQHYYAQSVQNHLQKNRSVAIIERNYQP
jgi:peptidyl-prolyl cis-trans isomerase C